MDVGKEVRTERKVVVKKRKVVRNVRDHKHVDGSVQENISCKTPICMNSYLIDILYLIDIS